jgi:hypothetical protein
MLSSYVLNLERLRVGRFERANVYRLLWNLVAGQLNGLTNGDLSRAFEIHEAHLRGLGIDKVTD